MALHLAHSRQSQARMSELLNILVQAGQAMHDEFDSTMGPDGQGWDSLLDAMFSGEHDLLSRPYGSCTVTEYVL